MSTTDAFSTSIPLATWARAVDGDTKALGECLRLDADGRGARAHRLAAALALEALRRELTGAALDPWRTRLRQVTAHHMLLADALERCGAILGEAGIRWLPIKGLDLCSRVYHRPEERPTSDIDLLIAGADLEPARQALTAAGWSPLQHGVRAERYLQEEGYAWQARHSRGALLELHFRLWGSVAAECGDVVVARAQRDPNLPTGGHRLRLADAFVVAAAHLWLDPPPRQLGAFRDLVAIARRLAGEGDDGDAARQIHEAAAGLDLQLPVLAAARVAAELWGETTCRRAADLLEPGLKSFERRWLLRQESLVTAPHAGMTLARHGDRRRTRHSLARILWRRIWAHPGIVESATEPDQSWIRRRLTFQARAFQLEKQR